MNIHTERTRPQYGARIADHTPITAVRDAYDEWHAGQSTGEGAWYELARRQILSHRLCTDASALEIGCGWGTFSAWLADQGADVIGADFAPVAIEKARELHQRPRLRFEVQDIESLPYDDGAFDLVVSCETIEHVPHPPVAVAELARVLRPGGTLLLTTPNYLSLTGLHRLWREATGRKWDEGGQPIAHFTVHPKTMRWVRAAGLRVVEVDGRGHYLPIPGRQPTPELSVPGALERPLRRLALHVLVRAVK